MDNNLGRGYREGDSHGKEMIMGVGGIEKETVTEKK